MFADLLLRAGPWGLNFLLWMSALVGASWVVGDAKPAGGSRHALWPLVLAGGFAAGCAWRDSLTLKALDVGAALLLLGLGAWHRQGANPWLATLSRYAMGLGQSAFAIATSFLLLVFRDIPWNRGRAGSWRRHVASAVLGLLLALPLLAVFGGLFSSADAAFRQLMTQLFDLNFDVLIGHLFFTAVGTWLAAGYLRTVLWEQRPTIPPVVNTSFLKLGPVEIGVALTCLNLLFLSFLAIQLRYFFGGAEQVEIVPGLTYAEYARRGFFELVTVAVLVLPLLLLADWLLRDAPRQRVFRWLAGSLIGMLFVIMASAVQRMRLYQQEFGLTELRLYTTVFMAWLALVFVWFLATVLRGRRERFVFGALAAGLATIALLHALNPDAWIARTNLERARQGKSFDAAYAASLSADAVPILAAALPELNADQRQGILRQWRRRWPAPAFADWRTASLARHDAKAALDTGASPTGR